MHGDAVRDLDYLEVSVLCGGNRYHRAIGRYRRPRNIASTLLHQESTMSTIITKDGTEIYY